VAEDAGRPLRAVQIAAAAGLSTDKAKVEGLRSKLKRLVERGWLVEQAARGCSRCRPARIWGVAKPGL
jgi:predicted ArsR family transcriptional regulator